MAELIDGKIVSAAVRKRIATETEKFKAEHGITPALAVILVGNDPASAVYVRNKHKGCLEVGMRSIEITMPEDKNIYVAGAKCEDGKLLTAGGRVLGVTETAPTLAEAIEKAYETVKCVNFENAYYRKDIGQRALKAFSERS